MLERIPITTSPIANKIQITMSEKYFYFTGIWNLSLVWVLSIDIWNFIQ
jgi:hypothetical protein